MAIVQKIVEALTDVSKNSPIMLKADESYELYEP